tara:strand:+ start:226 stop:870 length:645 start_codon:yes stop_codon:yes gene_type:complete
MANKKKTFKTIIEDQMRRGKMPQNVYESREWYRQKAIRTRSLRGVNTQRILKIGIRNQRMKPTLKGRMMLGKMFMFEYEAKGAEKMPFYDQFPLIFPIESYSNGFLGINLHYLPHTWRAVLMDSLYDLRTDENMDESTRLRLVNNGYNTLKKSAKYRYFRPCVKRYLNEQVKSRYMEVPSDEWEIAMFLPLERFVGASRRQVWLDSRNKYRNRR